MAKKIFKRKLYSQLLKWKQENDGKTAVLVEGARRVGKSTIVEHFAKNEYDSDISDLEDNNTIEETKSSEMISDNNSYYYVNQKIFGLNLSSTNTESNLLILNKFTFEINILNI